jgi:predicted HD phosphohydrolase
MDEFFQPENQLSKDSFEYIRKHLPSNNYAIESIENYFYVLSNVKIYLN